MTPSNNSNFDTDAESTAESAPPARRGADLVAAYVCDHFLGGDGVPHGEVVHWMLTEQDYAPDTADRAVQQALDDSLIHEPLHANLYHPALERHDRD